MTPNRTRRKQRAPTARQLAKATLKQIQWAQTKKTNRLSCGLSPIFMIPCLLSVHVWAREVAVGGRRFVRAHLRTRHSTK